MVNVAVAEPSRLITRWSPIRGACPELVEGLWGSSTDPASCGDFGSMMGSKSWPGGSPGVLRESRGR